MKKLIILLAVSTLMYQGTAAVTKTASTCASTTPTTNATVSSQTVTSYLQGYGYSVLSTPTKVASNKWSAYFSYNETTYQTYVYTNSNGTSILGHEDVPI